MLTFFYVSHPQGIGNPCFAELMEFFQANPTFQVASLVRTPELMSELLYLAGKRPSDFVGRTVLVLADWHFAYPHTKTLWVCADPTEADRAKAKEQYFRIT